jgi:hypothetical protein
MNPQRLSAILPTSFPVWQLGDYLDRLENALLAGFSARSGVGSAETGLIGWSARIPTHAFSIELGLQRSHRKIGNILVFGPVHDRANQRQFHDGTCSATGP